MKKTLKILLALTLAVLLFVPATVSTAAIDWPVYYSMLGAALTDATVDSATLTAYTGTAYIFRPSVLSQADLLGALREGKAITECTSLTSATVTGGMLNIQGTAGPKIGTNNVNGYESYVACVSADGYYVYLSTTTSANYSAQAVSPEGHIDFENSKNVVDETGKAAFTDGGWYSIHVHSCKETHASVAATVAADGVKAYYECACGNYFADEACTELIGKNAALETWKTEDGKIDKLTEEPKQEEDPKTDPEEKPEEPKPEEPKPEETEPEEKNNVLPIVLIAVGAVVVVAGVGAAVYFLVIKKKKTV